jgi:hypothetical protein
LRLVAAFLAAIDDRHAGSFGRKRPRDGQPNPAGAAEDHGDLVVQVKFHYGIMDPDGLGWTEPEM